jgi:hypothetical protein
VPLALTHQDAATFFASDDFIIGKTCNALQFDGVKGQVATFALIARKSGCTDSAIAFTDLLVES